MKIEAGTGSLRARLSQLADPELVGVARQQLPYVTIAYELLMERYQSRLYAICYRYIHDGNEADDICQEVMLKVFHHLRSFRGQSSFKTWLYRMAYNESISALRRKRPDALNIDSMDASDDPLLSEDSESDFSLNRLDQWLIRFSVVDRSIVFFRCIEELEFNEIAAVLDMKVSAVKMRYQRALEKLRTHLE